MKRKALFSIRQVSTAARTSRLVVGVAAVFTCVSIAIVAPARAECVWRGTAPACAGECNAAEIEVKRQGTDYVAEGEPDFGQYCYAGTKALCCTRCPQGLVWRDSHYLDTVCVTPAERDAAKAPPPPQTPAQAKGIPGVPPPKPGGGLFEPKLKYRDTIQKAP
jgi:hypothetical protein